MGMWWIPTVLLLQLGCPVEIGKLLEVRHSRGRPVSRHAFGDRYWVCRYDVSVRGVGYTYEHWVHDLPGWFDETVCEEPGTRHAARELIGERTEWCQDLDASDRYEGKVLKPR